MCGRIRQAELPDEYFVDIFMNMPKILAIYLAVTILFMA